MLLRVFLRYRRAVILSIALLVSFLFMTLQVRQEGPRLAEAGLENSRLRRLLDLPAGREFDLVAAQVIAKDTTNWFKTIMINKGSEAGVQRRLPVIATEGLVGRGGGGRPGAAQG